MRLAATVLAQRQHVPGKRRGHDGTIGFAIEAVHHAFLDMTVKFKGDVRPSYDMIARWARVGKGSVGRAIRILEAAGLLEHERKCVPREDAPPGKRGPQVKQAPNFYRVLVGPLLEILPRIRPRRVQEAATAEAQDRAKKARMAATLKRAAAEADLARRLGPEKYAALMAKLAAENGEATRSC